MYVQIIQKFTSIVPIQVIEGRPNRTLEAHDNSNNNLDAAVRTSVDAKSGKNDSLTTVQNSSDSFSNSSTALSVTIAIGCSLLVLNVLIFTAVYYQRDRNRDRNNKLENNMVKTYLVETETAFR